MAPDEVKTVKLDEIKDPAVDPMETLDADDDDTLHVSELTHLNRDHVGQRDLDNSDYDPSREEAERDHIRQDEPK